MSGRIKKTALSSANIDEKIGSTGLNRADPSPGIVQRKPLLAFLGAVLLLQCQGVLWAIFSRLFAKSSVLWDFSGIWKIGSSTGYQTVILIMLENFLLYLFARLFRSIQLLASESRCEPRRPFATAITFVMGCAWVVSEILYNKYQNRISFHFSLPVFLIEDFFFPIAEEFIFRGLLLTIMRKSIKNILLLATVDSVIFSLAHFDFVIPHMVTYFGCGVLFSFLFLLSGSIWPGVVIHISYNTVADFVRP